VISYLKNIFLKREAQFSNKKISEQENHIDSIKELKLSNNEKIELLLKRHFCLQNDDILDSSSLTLDFGCDYYDLEKLISELEHVFDIKVQEGAFQLTAGGIKEYVKRKMQNPNYIVPDENLHIDYWPLSLEQILCYEHRYLAIKKLLANNYVIYNEASGNPYEELILFTLKYFYKHYIEKPIEAEKLLIASFPTTHLFIKRQISNPQNEFTNSFPINEQDAYDEFLLFCKNTFCLLYPNKSLRDKQIKHNFKMLHDALIQFIDNDQVK
jgi:hypothetical protein